jgi:hypothetical protein
MSKKFEHKELSGVDSKTLGNFTKNAVKRFENNIVNQVGYLEKVEEAAGENEKKQPRSFT